jgi:hypothetical protein
LAPFHGRVLAANDYTVGELFDYDAATCSKPNVFAMDNFRIAPAMLKRQSGGARNGELRDSAADAIDETLFVSEER